MPRAENVNYIYFSTFTHNFKCFDVLLLSFSSSLLPHTKLAAEAHLLLQLHVKMIRPMGWLLCDANLGTGSGKEEDLFHMHSRSEQKH